MKTVVTITGFILLLSLTLSSVGAAPPAQFAAPNQAGVRMGHLYFIVRDVAAAQKFWIAFGATPVRMNEKEAVLRMPDLLIFLSKGEPVGGSEGSVVDHVGFLVPNVKKQFANMQAAGFRTDVPETARARWNTGGRATTAYAFTPDGEMIEYLEDGAINAKIYRDDGTEIVRPKETVPSVLHHIHFDVPEASVPELKAWYVNVFGGVPGRRWNYQAVHLPGMSINISAVATAQAPTKGRMFDHYGFEVKNLKAFCEKLQANGVKLDQPYKKQPGGYATAYLTDPWGVSIELTEGLH